jgi:hypothetical protein
VSGISPSVRRRALARENIPLDPPSKGSSPMRGDISMTQQQSFAIEDPLPSPPRPRGGSKISMSTGDSVSSISILEIGQAEILPPWTGGARGGVFSVMPDSEDPKTDGDKVIGPRKWEMNPSKGEFCTMLRVVFGIENGPGCGRVAFHTPRTVVARNSPFEGGSRGMFFTQTRRREAHHVLWRAVRKEHL